MQLNFLGLVMLGIGIVVLGLGISGNYKTFGKSVKLSVGGSEKTKGKHEKGAA